MVTPHTHNDASVLIERKVQGSMIKRLHFFVLLCSCSYVPHFQLLSSLFPLLTLLSPTAVLEIHHLGWQKLLILACQLQGVMLMWAKYLVDGRSQTIMTRMLTVIQVQGTLKMDCCRRRTHSAKKKILRAVAHQSWIIWCKWYECRESSPPLFILTAAAAVMVRRYCFDTLWVTL